MSDPDEPANASEESPWIRQDKKRSWVWSHFKVDKNDKTRIKCDHCPTIYKHSSSTTDLIRHLASAHHIKKPGTEAEPVDKGASATEALNTSNQPGIRAAFAKKATEPLDLVSKYLVIIETITKAYSDYRL